MKENLYDPIETYGEKGLKYTNPKLIIILSSSAVSIFFLRASLYFAVFHIE